METLTTILLFSSLLGFLFSINLIISWFRNNKQNSKSFLAIYLFFLSLIILDNWESLKYVNKSSLWILDAYGFSGPAMCFFIKTFKTFNTKILKKTLLLFSIGILEIGIQLLRIIDFNVFETSLLYDSTYAHILEVLEIVAYVLTIILLFPTVYFIKNKASTLEKPALTRLILLLSSHIILIIGWSVSLSNGNMSITMGAGISLLAAAVIIILVSDIIQNPKFIENRTQKINKRKRKIDALEKASKDAEYLKTKIVEFELYKDMGLNLNILSTKISMSKDYISELLNHKIGQSFRNYINELRIEEAKKMLKNSKYNHLSILGIAYEVGFKSESTFYSVFKKHTGQTPKSFRTN